MLIQFSYQIQSRSRKNPFLQFPADGTRGFPWNPKHHTTPQTYDLKLGSSKIQNSTQQMWRNKIWNSLHTRGNRIHTRRGKWAYRKSAIYNYQSYINFLSNLYTNFFFQATVPKFLQMQLEPIHLSLHRPFQDALPTNKALNKQVLTAKFTSTIDYAEFFE